MDTQGSVEVSLTHKKAQEVLGPDSATFVVSQDTSLGTACRRVQEMSRSRAEPNGTG